MSVAKEFDTNSPEIVDAIHLLIQTIGEDPASFEGDLITQQMQTSLGLLIDEHHTGQLKLITRALKEMRYAFNIFNQYPDKKRISIFGSARTAPDHPDYIEAKLLSEKMTEEEWMCITGAAHGIMKAGLEGAKAKTRFGLAIRLPFEEPLYELFEDDHKHILFRYFFTRKLMFLSQADAIAVFPGGYGTSDELFEALTLMQTGKNNIVPVVLVEAEGRSFWKGWETYVKDHLLANGMIAEEDLSLFHVCQGAEEAAEHISTFYKRYHSSRYVKDNLVIRLNESLSEDQLALLNKEYASILKGGEIFQTKAHPEEGEFEELPRLTMHHDRRHFGKLRQMIDQINAFKAGHPRKYR
jgi:hypothetical protein